ncbi:hypothetical protein LZZ85_10705 [Terrimonas sp. NA20]|uniref:Lipoprotein n=1 Tax=Terrimonas ginsenosidimutans TaxID=2908004 RepID=A0ABS9KR21_9BACT|nr:hypothetical protein [Terrimonas ginsenosidimutans]MCG2614755.1 hypothetical protein [Terrimonas ginsenosidimutans]
MRYLILFLSFTLLLAGCGRDKDEYISGIVIEKSGCLPDSYLVELPGEVGKKKPYLCETTVPLATLLNCTNSVYIRLPPALAIAGKKIRFLYVDTQPSCLSYSFAPQHITVKSLRAD